MAITPIYQNMTAQTSQGQPVTLSVGNASQALKNLPQGTLIQGEIVGNAAGQKGLIVKSEMGALRLLPTEGQKLPTLPAGTKITLQVTQPANSGQAAPQIALMPPGIKAPLPGMTLASLFGGSQNAAHGQAVQVTPTLSLTNLSAQGTPNSAIQAIVVNSAGSGVSGANPALPLPGAHSSLPQTGQNTAPSLNTAGSNSPTINLATTAIASGQNLPSQAGSMTGTNALAHLTQGQSLSIKLNQITLPGQNQPLVNIPTAAQIPVLSGTISQMTSQGFPQIQTAGADILLLAKTDLPVGTKLGFSVANNPASQTSPPPTSLFQQGWGKMDQLLSHLSQTDKAMMTQLLSQLPQANQKMAATMSQLVNHMRQGNLAPLFTPQLQAALEKSGKGDLLKSLSQDMVKLGKNSQEAVSSQEWRAIPIPFHHQGRVEQIELFMRKAKAERPEDEGQRFVFELPMEKLGRTQIDGLIRQKNIDLILRVEGDLSADQKQHFQDLFHQAIEITGAKGQFHIQTKADFPVNPRGDVSSSLQSETV